jgi:hypothetical protein
LETVSTVVGLAAWGAHAAVPWRLARQPPEARRLWRLAAPPLLAAGVAAGLWRIAAAPDRALAAGIATLPLGSRFAAWICLTIFALAAADGLIALGGARLEPLGWRLASLLGCAALGSSVLAAELMRAEAPVSQATPTLLAAAACRAAVGLAAADLLSPGRPVATPAAGIAAALYPLLLPRPLLRALVAHGVVFTLGAAAALLLLARFVPRRLQRLAVAAGLLLAGLGLARATELSAAITVLRL